MTTFFKKLFGSKEENSTKLDITDEPTVPVDYEEIADLIRSKNIAHLETDTPQIGVACAQSVGIVRDHNEDALFTFTTNLTNQGENLPLGLYIVADGMGGHKHGEIASELAVRSMGSDVIRKVFLSLLNESPSPPEGSIREIFSSSIQKAHEVIAEEAPGGGTTLTAVLIAGGQMTIAQVGDSRLYLISQKSEIKPLTQDHSIVARMVELGQLSPEEAAVHPQRNVLYRALGQGEPFEPDITNMQIPESGYLLICSDGLWGTVPEDEMAQIIIKSESLEQASQNLVDAANAAGGPDNITAIVVRLPKDL